MGYWDWVAVVVVPTALASFIVCGPRLPPATFPREALHHSACDSIWSLPKVTRCDCLLWQDWQDE